MGKILCWLVWRPGCKFIHWISLSADLPYSMAQCILCPHTPPEQGYTLTESLTSALTKAAWAHDPVPERLGAAQRGSPVAAAGLGQRGTAEPCCGRADGTAQLQGTVRVCAGLHFPPEQTGLPSCRGQPEPVLGCTSLPSSRWRCSSTSAAFKTFTSSTSTGATRIFNTFRFVM